MWQVAHDISETNLPREFPLFHFRFATEVSHRPVESAPPDFVFFIATSHLA